jgi:phosphodiesterase/alkaline phosphatase D-like protein
MNKWMSKVLSIVLTFCLVIGAVGGAVAPVQAAELDEQSSFIAAPAANDAIILLPANSIWKYLDDGSNQMSVWRAVYDDSLWESGKAPLGYKDDGSIIQTAKFGELNKSIRYGTDKKNKHITTYFRTTIDVPNVDEFERFVGEFAYDDGFVLYLNGTEILREGMPTGDIDFKTVSLNNNGNPNLRSEADLTDKIKGALHNGTNELAAEVHQGRGNSSDLYWDMELLAYKQGIVEEGKPSSIALTYNGDPKTSMAFAWYTPKGVTGTKLEVVEADKVTGSDFPSSEANVYEGTSVTASVYMSKADKNAGKLTVFTSHKAIASGLKPGMKYAYRAGDGHEKNWSEIGTFTTERESNQDFMFLYTTDSQGTSKADFDIWNHTLEEGRKHFPQSEFILNAGDLVDNGDLEEQWGWFFGQAKGILMNYPLVPIVGNHESKKYDNFTMHFNLPTTANIGAKPEGSVYSFDYGNAHFMVLNTEYSGAKADDKDIYEKQVEWLRSEVAKTDKKWKVVFLHKSPYSVAKHVNDSDVKFYRENLTKVFDELGIDMVLGGHDHTYARSYQMYDNTPLKEFMPDANGQVIDPKGTLYVLTNAAGNKIYQPGKGPFTYAAKFGQPNKEMFTGVQVLNDTLSFEAFTTKTGGTTELYDKYSIKKSDVVANPVQAAQANLSKDGKLTLTWQAPKQGSAVTAYRIYEKNDLVRANWNATVQHVEGTQSYSYTLDNLDPNKSYSFVIRAVNGRTNSEPVVASTLKVSKVTVTFHGDTTTSKGFTWYTGLPSTNSDVQVVEKTSDTPDFTHALRASGRTKVSSNSMEEHVHKAEITGLKPNTAYYFRVGDESLHTWSEVGTFRTAPAGGAFTFIDLADTQAKTEDEAILSAETIEKAIATIPDATFFHINGDIVDKGTTEQQWDWLLGHSQKSLNHITIVPSAGNHEDKNNAFYEHFNVKEAPNSDTKTGAYYSYDYSNAHFIILNTNEDSDEYRNFTSAQVEWLKQDVAAAKAAGAQWIIVNIHKGPYTTSNHATDEDIMGQNGVRNKIVPIMAELGIDFVMQGHDHIYARTKPITSKGTAAKTEKITELFNGQRIEYTKNPDGTIYMIPSTAGPKVYYKNQSESLGDAYYNLFEVADESHGAKYGPDPNDPRRPMRSQVQNFVGITIDGNKLSAITYEIDQNKDNAKPFIIDAFGILKQKSDNGNTGNNGGSNNGSGSKPSTNPGGTKPNTDGTKGTTDGKKDNNGSTTQPNTGKEGSHEGKPSKTVLKDIAGHWAASAIEQAVDRGIVTGYTDGTFRPKQAINRAEFSAMLARALQLNEAGNGLSFTDTKSIPAWAQPFVAQAQQSGIVKGYGDNTFRPAQNITRAELAVMVVRAAGLQVDQKAKLNVADAKEVPAWAAPYIAAGMKAGLLKGVANNRFAPNEHATRAEAVAMIISLLQVK